MKIRKQTAFICILTILAIIFTACNRGSGTQKSAAAAPQHDASQHAALQFVHPVEFNGETIPVTVFYTDDSYGGYNLDRMVFVYTNKQQTINLQFDEPLNFPKDYYDWYIKADDYNFDGFMDIAVFNQNLSNANNETYEHFLYNHQTERYDHFPQLSQMGVWLNYERKTVNTGARGANAGMPFTFNEYKWENGQLVLFSSGTQDYNDDTELYTLTSQTLQMGSYWAGFKEMFYVHHLEFKDEPISINVYVVPLMSGSSDTKIDDIISSLRFNYIEGLHIIDLSFLETVSYKGPDTVKISAGDYNSDGFMDINYNNEIILYNPQIKSYPTPNDPFANAVYGEGFSQ